MDWLCYEKEAYNEGRHLVCGVDEAGRGPLAGPVVAAAVILPEGEVIEGINDSKKLTEKKRKALFDVITERALAWSVAFASEKEIDEINILQATFLTMKRAVEGLSLCPDFVLVDGNRLPNWKYPSRAIVKGDALSASVAAASILAKVSRDRLMVELSKQYPKYCFEKHKGYGTALHVELLKKYGPSDVHRRTFLTKILGGAR